MRPGHIDGRLLVPGLCGILGSRKLRKTGLANFSGGGLASALFCGKRREHGGVPAVAVDASNVGIRLLLWQLKFA